MTRDKDYQLLTLNSQVTALTVLAQVASLGWIKKERQAIKPPRVRDIFDLCFINQKLGKGSQDGFWRPQETSERKAVIKAREETEKNYQRF